MRRNFVLDRLVRENKGAHTRGEVDFHWVGRFGFCDRLTYEDALRNGILHLEEQRKGAEQIALGRRASFVQRMAGWPKKSQLLALQRSGPDSCIALNTFTRLTKCTPISQDCDFTELGTKSARGSVGMCRILWMRPARSIPALDSAKEFACEGCS